MFDFYAKTRIRFSLRDKRLFKITEVEITSVDYILFDCFLQYCCTSLMHCYILFIADIFDAEMSEEDNSKENLDVDKEKKVFLCYSKRERMSLSEHDCWKMIYFFRSKKTYRSF